MGFVVRVGIATALVPLPLATAFAAPPEAQTRASKTVTIFYDAPGGFSPAALEAMQRELSLIMSPSDLRFEWLQLVQAPEAGAVSDLVLIRFKGACSMGPLPPLADELGPFAWTSVVDRVVQPFTEVDCDRLRRAVYLALWGGLRTRGDLFLGRALGRIVAHEIYHIFSRSLGHQREGLARHALSAADLISERLNFHPEDLHKLLRPQ
jgi:hypothetical protein